MAYGDETKFNDAINESGTVLDTAKKEQYMNTVDGHLETEFLYILSDSIPFQSVPDWLKVLATDGYVACFWFKENTDQKIWDEWKNRVTEKRMFFFQQPPAMTR